ncbi:MAG: endo alpha-1,4 polygalactosaminidase, partial [Bacteroidales bacterium]|nr:endo alpha-1,4 polygalactosaminidase [Bacteroidales bacterium]
MNYKQEMRDFVIGISEYSKSLHPGFIIIPQNGIELVSVTGDEDGQPHSAYLNAIDGNGQEDLFYGYDRDDKPTPNNENSYLRTYLNISKNSGNTILVTDYCSTVSNMNDSYSQNNLNGFTSFAADHRELDNIPAYPSPIYSQNDSQISSLSQIQNFLYLINPENFSTKSDFINTVTSSNYDLMIMDLFFHDGIEFISSEINQLKSKANGGRRLVIAYMSIGEAEDYRYYWQNDWNNNEPAWMDKENPNWEGNFKVKYWYEDWQNVIYGSENSYLDKILDAGFDGVY